LQQNAGSIELFEYIQSKDYFTLPEQNSITPFCEGIQDLQRKLTKNVNPVRLGGYCVNGRMLFAVLNVIIHNLNTSKIPNFHDLFISLINKEVNTNLEEAREIFQSEFADLISEEMEETQIDSLYQSTVGIIMKHIRGNLDPYLNVGEEIDQLFSEFSEIYSQAKQNSHKYHENLDYSESMEGSKLLETPIEENKVQIKHEDDEFNINMLNSEFDQTAKPCQTSSKKSGDFRIIEKSFNSNSNFDLFATIEKLQKE